MFRIFLGQPRVTPALNSAVTLTLTAMGFLSIVDVYIDDIPFHAAPTSVSRTGVTVHLLSETGADMGHLRFVHRGTVADLMSALDFIQSNWISEPEL